MVNVYFRKMKEIFKKLLPKKQYEAFIKFVDTGEKPTRKDNTALEIKHFYGMHRKLILYNKGITKLKQSNINIRWKE